jgi:hypothetical protein
MQHEEADALSRITRHLIIVRIAVLLVALQAVASVVTPPSRAAAATYGDIPDSANYLTFTAPHFKVQFIEGWGRQGSGGTVTFSDKDSLERVALLATPRGSLAAFVRGPELTNLRRAHATRIGSPRPVSLPGGRGWYLQYTVPSTPDLVTGKVVSLLTDRYYLSGPHQLAVLTLASPLGDDNVDAFRRIAHSFSWR